MNGVHLFRGSLRWVTLSLPTIFTLGTGSPQPLARSNPLHDPDSRLPRRNDPGMTKTGRFLWRLTLVMLLFAATLLSLLRLLLPETVQYRPEFESLVSNLMGRTVHFKELAAEIHGFEPRLNLLNVAIMDAQGRQPAVQLDALRIEISILKSVLNWQLIPDKIVVVGPRFRVLRLARQSFQIGGYAIRLSEQQQGLDEGLLRWLLQQEELQVRHAQVELQSLDDPEQGIRLSDLSLDMKKAGNNRKLVARAEVQGAVIGGVKLAAYLENPDANDLRRITSRWHLQTSGLTLQDYSYGDHALSGALDLDYWGSFSGMEPQQQGGEFSLRDFSLTRQSTETGVTQPFHATRISAGFGWTSTANAWGVALDDLRVEHGSHGWSSPNLSLQHHWGAAATRIRMDRLDAADGLALFRSFSPSAMAYPAQVGGSLTHIDLHVRQGLAALINGDFNLRELQIDETVDQPGIAGLSGIVAIRGKEGSLRLDSSNLQVSRKQVFRQPISAGHASGKLRWSIAEDGIRLRGDQLLIRSPGVDASGLFTLDLPRDSEPVLFALADVSRANGKDVGYYLPAGIMPEKTVAWIDKGILDAKVTGGRILLHGNPRQFPYRNHNGRFLVDAQFTDGRLNYQADRAWPLLEAISGSLMFDGDRMEITAESARTLNARVSKARAVIPHLGHTKEGGLGIDGEVAGDLSDVLRFLRESPLQARIPKTVTDIKASGPQSFALHLDIPLKAGTQVGVVGRGAFSEARVVLPIPAVELERVAAQVEFTENMVKISKGAALGFGKEVTFELTNSPSGKGRSTRIDARGLTATRHLAELLHFSADRFASGDVRWQGTLTLDATTTFSVQTDLSQVALDLPAPLGKPAGEPLTSTVTGTCHCAQQEPLVEVTMHSSRDLSAGMEIARIRDNWRVSRADLVFGETPELPAEGLSLRGVVPEVNIEEWREWLKQSPNSASNPLLRNIAIHSTFGKVAAFGQVFTDLGVNGTVTENAWNIDLAGAQVAGALSRDRKSPAQKVLVDLAHLKLGSIESLSKSTLDPASIPPLDLYIGSLSYGEKNLGSIDLITSQQKNGLVADNAKLRVGSSRWTGSGSWTAGKDGQRTAVDFQVETGDFAEVLQVLNLNPLVRDGKGQGSASLFWSGAPQELSLAKLSGNLQVELKDGSIRDMEPGLGRLFGILSIRRLEKRLLLDFSDVLGKGLVFDQLKGNLTLDQGKGRLEKLRIHGPATHMSMSGAINLGDHSLDLVVTSIPQITSSLPIAATIGSLGLGAAVYVGQQLLEKSIDQLTDRRYAVTGTWDDPKVERIP